MNPYRETNQIRYEVRGLLQGTPRLGKSVNTGNTGLQTIPHHYFPLSRDLSHLGREEKLINNPVSVTRGQHTASGLKNAHISFDKNKSRG